MMRSSIVYSLKSIINQADKILLENTGWSCKEEFWRGSNELKDFFKKHSTDRAVLQVVNEIPYMNKPSERKNILTYILVFTIALAIFFIAEEAFECSYNSDFRFQVQEMREKYVRLLALIEDSQL